MMPIPPYSLFPINIKRILKELLIKYKNMQVYIFFNPLIEPKSICIIMSKKFETKSNARNVAARLAVFTSLTLLMLIKKCNQRITRRN